MTDLGDYKRWLAGELAGPLAGVDMRKPGVIVEPLDRDKRVAVVHYQLGPRPWMHEAGEVSPEAMDRIRGHLRLRLEEAMYAGHPVKIPWTDDPWYMIAEFLGKHRHLIIWRIYEFSDWKQCIQGLERRLGLRRR